ncbi:GNAT family N-acetyltransferase [Paenibacillus nanensis]|uniref:GNAT family N-acetyltransferase n=1 Tax=Paenibacillus nanensis TaxID=393251 RepID=A0A3A1UW85_9BACL|nr:GNAT family N-acetyltransferase [Paenibacillus nanensis]RIX48725.1 GNAT family N-acetyltransferase [Paenibacillus nanensis]
MGKMRNVAVLLYERADTLDVTGPYDVFGAAGFLGKDFSVYTFSLDGDGPIRTVSGLAILPDYSAENLPAPDILVIPGGWGARQEMHNERLTSWIRETAANTEIVLSVCTGALLLAKAGLLENLGVTTNRRAMDLLREAAPASATVYDNVRYVDNGHIVTSGGVTAGIDAALYLVSRLHGEQRALETASMLEYQWNRELPAVVRGEALTIRRATNEDAAALRALLIEAAGWIQSVHGIRQWREQMFTREIIDDFIRDYEVFVALQGQELAGCFSVHWGYEEIWGEKFHDDAGYVHRLTVSRSRKGQEIGKQLLDWAENYIRERGKSWLRLDCMAENPSLNSYYQGLGFILQGRFDASGWSANLYERKIRQV